MSTRDRLVSELNACGGIDVWASSPRVDALDKLTADGLATKRRLIVNSRLSFSYAPTAGSPQDKERG